MEDHPDFLPFDNGDINQLIEKFEEMTAQGAQYYFDVEEFEELIDFYLVEANLETVQILIELGKGQHPDSISIQLKEAESLVYNEKAVEAIKIIESVSLFADSNPEHYFSKASIYSMADQKDKAIETLQYLIKISDNEDLVDAKMALAKEYQEIGDYHESIQVYLEIIHFESSNEDALMELTLSCEHSLQYDLAIKHLDDFINNNPYSHFAWFLLGNMYMTMEDYSEAIVGYEYATLINEDFSEAFFNLGNAHMKEEQFELAIEAYKSSIHPEFVDPITYNFIGHCYIVLEKNEEAITYFQKAIDQSPEYADGWLGFAVAYSNLDNSKEGLLYIEKALKLNPENQYYHYFHADLLVNIGDSEGAEKIYERVYQSKMDNTGIFSDYAETLILNGKVEQALEVLMDGITQYPEESNLYFKYAAALIQQSEILDAESILYIALEMDPAFKDQFLTICPEAINYPTILDLLENYN